MASSLQAMADKGLVKPPSFVVSNLCFEAIVGSTAYGTSTDVSDQDLYGWCIPHKDIVFPHLAGYIPGFGQSPPAFNQFCQHHVIDTGSGKEYDFTIYGIVRYFQLCMQCNPNMIDSLFVPDSCVKHITTVGQMVRDNRKLFLSKLAWPAFRGYSASQLHKMAIKTPQAGSKRAVNFEKHGWDTKYGMHLIRLLGEVHQILEYEDLDLQQNTEQLKAIRRGALTEVEVRNIGMQKIQNLESLYHTSQLRAKPDEAVIKQLLLDCLEHHYGSLSNCVSTPDAAIVALNEIDAILHKVRHKI